MRFCQICYNYLFLKDEEGRIGYDPLHPLQIYEIRFWIR
jgi:hypothetical protein